MADKLIISIKHFLTNDTQITEKTTYGRVSLISWALKMVSDVTLCSLLLDKETSANGCKLMGGSVNIFYLSRHLAYTRTLLMPVM